jgi:catechol 2,3-dioxygenase-like lactoylglutathione lyase family enzyme
MTNMNLRCTAVLLSISFAGLAQLAAPGDSGVSMGHIHLHTKDPDAQKKFWIELLGAQETKLGNWPVAKMPSALIILQKADWSGGSDGSIVNHIAVKVRDLKATLAKIEAAHITVISQNPPQAMLLAPDDVRVELTEDTSLTQPVAYHHIHFYTPNVDEMKKWYVDTFGAVPGKRGRFEAADLPGVNLTFVPAPGTVVATKGRSLDHIGFEVRNLEAFTKKMEAGGAKFDVTYRKIPALGVAVAFLTDPWGTYIELTEGLDKL